MDDEPEITLTPGTAGQPPAPPAPSDGEPPAPAMPGLTPAFAGSGTAAPSEPARSIWDWPGPAREPRRAGDRATTNDPPPPPMASSESRPPRGGVLPSVPRSPGSTESTTRTTEPSKERDATLVVSPPPAPPAAPPLPGLPPRAAKPAAPTKSKSSSAAAPAPEPAKPAAPEPKAPSAASPAASPVASPPPVPPAAAAPSPALAPPVLPRTISPQRAAVEPRPPRRAHSDSVGAAFDQAIDPGDRAQSEHGVSTVEDLAEVRRVFNDVAAVHVAQVRDVMLELRYGDAQPSWIESTQPALRSLRTMAAQMELTELCQALDGFCVAVDAAVGGRSRIDDGGKAELLHRYERLIELIPQAFELDAERDRREPIIVEALLYQVAGVEKRTIEKLFAVGLNRLDALMQATADEIAVVAGLHQDLADAIVEQFRSYRKGASSALAAPDPLAERRALGDLLIMLSVQNDEYAHNATRWTDEARARKHEARKQREQVFQRIKVALARLGERDQLTRLERMPFDERIAALDRYLSAAMPARTQPGKP